MFKLKKRTAKQAIQNEGLKTKLPDTQPELDADTLPEYVQVIKYYTVNPTRGFVIYFGMPGKGQNFRLRCEHWTESRAYQVAWEICGAVGWPQEINELQILPKLVNAARVYARSRHYTIVR